MRVFKVEAENEESARKSLADELGIGAQDLKHVQTEGKNFSFEAICLPARVEVDISRDKMSAKITRINKPIGNSAPPLTSDYVIEKLKEAGVSEGIKYEELAEFLFTTVSKPDFKDGKPLNFVVAEGTDPVPAQSGRPQWEIDLKIFQKNKPVFAKKGEILARASMAVKGEDGITVTGERIEAEVDDQFRLNVGKGIQIVLEGDQTLYKTEACGQLFYDEGIRMRLESKLIDLEDGLKAAIDTAKTSIKGKPITAKDLVESAKTLGIEHGLLSIKEVQAQLDSTKKWPARIVVAKGTKPVDGKPGKVTHVFRRAKSEANIDQERAKARIVFPGEVITKIGAASEPEEGQTVFGEKIRGRSYNEMPVYSGKNVSQSRDGEETIFKSNIYGRVKIEEDRIRIENILRVDKDKMKARLDVFPQQKLSFEDLQVLLRDRDVLFGFDKDSLEMQLDQIHKSAAFKEGLVVAKAQPVSSGRNAKLRYYFSPEHLKKKGLIVKSKPKEIFAAPNDLLLEKILPVEAEPGCNVYREKIPVPSDKKSVDVEIGTGKNIIEKIVGEEGNEKDPLRVEYRAATFGLVQWANRNLDLRPLVQVDDNEEVFSMRLRRRSDFGTRVGFEMLQAFANEEGVKVELDRKGIEQALRAQKNSGSNDLVYIELARSTPAKNGANAVVEYHNQINGESLDQWLTQAAVDKVESCDCVRPKEVIAEKTPAGVGEDGKTVFGRRITAERGEDEPWQIGFGVDRSEDGNQLVVVSDTPGFVLIEDRRIVVKNTVEIASDKMSAKMVIYPSKSARFAPREEKIMQMIQGKGIQLGINEDAIRGSLQQLSETGEPQELEIAKGQPAEVGREARHRFALQLENSAGQLRDDGSIDYKAASIFQTVVKGQLLLIKQPPTRGEDGFNILGDRLPGMFGPDHKVEAGEGVTISDDGVEYHASRDGIVEFTKQRIRVIEGLLIPGDVDYSTGNIDAGPALVMVKGAVLPGFSVKSECEITIEKEAEACELISDKAIRLNGGIIGKGKGLVRSGGSVEALYINSESIVEAAGDVQIGNEVLNSSVRTGGWLSCENGAGKVAGGELWVFGGLRARELGAQSSETQTVVHMGIRYEELQKAQSRIREEGLEDKENELKAKVAELDKELTRVYDEIPEASKSSQDEAARLQAMYRELHGEKRELDKSLEIVLKQKEAILKTVKRNPDCKVLVRDTVHPGVTFIYGDVEWTLKEPLRSIQILWNASSNNLISKRL